MSEQAKIQNSQIVSKKVDVLEGRDLELFLESLEQENGSIPAQCLKFLLCQEGGAKVSSLSYLKWSGVEFEKESITNRYPMKKDLSVIESTEMDEPTKHLLRELSAARDEESPFVFPVAPGKSLANEVRNVLRRVSRRAGLEGVTFAVLKKSFMPGVKPKIAPIFPLSAQFQDLPESIRKEAVGIALTTEPNYTWPTTHQDFQRGREAAVDWLDAATLYDIAYLASEHGGSPTYVGITAMGNAGEDYDSDLLCISPVGYAVQEILGLDTYPKATEENIQFEAGFHLFLRELDGLLGHFIQRYWD